MKLFALLPALQSVCVTGPTTVEIAALCHDSRQVVPRTAFFALRGGAFDGHRFIDQAVAAGANVIVMEQEQPLPAGIAGVVVGDTRLALARAAAAWYGDPGRRGPLVGVTGTNGKTTTTYLVEALLRAAGLRPAVFGTVSYRFEGASHSAAHTTPDPLELLEIAAEFAAAGADAMVMEVSSHALDQHRVDGLSFSVGIFTNLTPEHLDYHSDMEGYFASKRRFFIELLAGGRCVLNVDDAFGQRLAGELPQALTFGLHVGAAVHPQQIEISLQGINGTVATPAGVLELRSALLGRFNLQNLLGAIAAGLALDLPLTTIAAGLAQAAQVPGRCERIENRRGAQILVDYAHTGDALEKVLATLCDLKPRRVFTVFGCGGDRDRSKRQVMGEIAARYSDLAIVTSDNPRTEEPLAIIDEIRVGLLRVHAREWSRSEAERLQGRGFIAIPDRHQAIGFAVALLRPDDLLLVAGKGHEDYQIIGRQRHHFDDREEVRAALAATAGGPA